MIFVSFFVSEHAKIFKEEKTFKQISHQNEKGKQFLIPSKMRAWMNRETKLRHRGTKKLRRNRSHTREACRNMQKHNVETSQKEKIDMNMAGENERYINQDT